MPKTYHAIQHWDQWLTQFLGENLLQAEKEYLRPLLQNFSGSHAVLIGSPQQKCLIDSSIIKHQVLFSPLFHKNNAIHYVETDFRELPLFSGSVDLVILPHVLEFVDNPNKILAEVLRVVKPSGHIIILGFNPTSLWGLKKHLMKSKHTPWNGNFVKAQLIKKWLEISEFTLVKHERILFRPPVSERWFHKIKCLEWFGKKFFNLFGGVDVITARADVVPLTPIKLHWKQQLPNVNIISTGLPRPSIRNMP